MRYDEEIRASLVLCQLATGSVAVALPGEAPLMKFSHPPILDATGKHKSGYFIEIDVCSDARQPSAYQWPGHKRIRDLRISSRRRVASP